MKNASAKAGSTPAHVLSANIQTRNIRVQRKKKAKLCRQTSQAHRDGKVQGRSYFSKSSKQLSYSFLMHFKTQVINLPLLGIYHVFPNIMNCYQAA
ncbi:hypothetical protein XELAEV_18020379mg [Xenopus laevis]|uniref:Uncharacterized protein n=1 Tax=Xenopus laevis TaxID=8355 RepID=A0A974D9L5_XENLA|nr:hypothetical protein XELAEV_18020379mg [Xenopus laevis]